MNDIRYFFHCPFHQKMVVSGQFQVPTDGWLSLKHSNIFLRSRQKRERNKNKSRRHKSGFELQAKQFSVARGIKYKCRSAASYENETFSESRFLRSTEIFLSFPFFLLSLCPNLKNIFNSLHGNLLRETFLWHVFERFMQRSLEFISFRWSWSFFIANFYLCTFFNWRNWYLSLMFTWPSYSEDENFRSTKKFWSWNLKQYRKKKFLFFRK